MRDETVLALAAQLSQVCRRDSTGRPSEKMIVQLSGRGEPFLHPRIVQVAQMLSMAHVQLWTGGLGVPMGSSRLVQLGNMWLDSRAVDLVVTQTEDEGAQFVRAHAEEVAAVRRSGWGEWPGDDIYYPHAAFSIPRLVLLHRPTGHQLTNQAGTLPIWPSRPPEPCLKRATTMMLAWDGTWMFCDDDWQDLGKLGTILDTDIHTAWGARRPMMDEQTAPCSECSRHVHADMYLDQRTGRWLAHPSRRLNKTVDRETLSKFRWQSAGSD